MYRVSCLVLNFINKKGSWEFEVDFWDKYVYKLRVKNKLEWWGKFKGLDCLGLRLEECGVNNSF